MEFRRVRNQTLGIHYSFRAGKFRICARLFFAFLFCFLFCFVFQTASAQTISGTVTDAQNAPIAGASVSLKNQNKTLAQTTTDAEGKFNISANNETNPTLKITANGFNDYEKSVGESDFGAPLTIILAPRNLRESVTVSITQTETRLSETPASVVVLTRENLDATAAQTIDDALRQIAGFALFRRSSSRTTNPTAQGANFRGLAGSGASRASVLLDGISINDAFGGWTYWTRVPKSAIEQIETLRGGASSLYGDAALSGAINLQTKSTGDAPVLRFETSAGTQKTFDASVFGAAGKNGWNVSASLDAFKARGYIPIAAGERGAADFYANSRYQNGFITIEKRLSEPSAVAGGFFNNSRIFLRGNLFSENRDNGTRLQTNRTYFRQAVFGADFPETNPGAFQLRAFVEKQIYDQIFSGVSADRNTENLTRIQRVPSQAFGANLFWSKAFGNHAVSSAFEFRDVRGASDETIFTNNRATSAVGAGGKERAFSVSAQDFWRAGDKLNLSFGARFDAWENKDALSATRNLTTNQTAVVNFPNRRESAFSPRLAALYRLNENFSLYAAFSKSFRAPTLNELYRAFRVGNVLTLANENLKSERADNFEGGINFTSLSGRLNLRGNVFVAEVSRPVVSVTLSSTPNLITRQRRNVGKTRARGLELDAEFLLRRDLRFSASCLLVDSRVARFPDNPDLVGKFLPQVARQQLNLQMFYRPPARFSFGAQARISGAQFEDDLNSLRLRPFFTLDVFASYRAAKKIEIFTAIENVFNRRYDIGLTPNRTVAAPRFARVGLRFDLGKR
ncbi:MAG TPA: TonB-dependent receptor [Pyrinomonadaceae bacterium]|jgi:outer membrane receptor protein involved in Fe transport